MPIVRGGYGYGLYSDGDFGTEGVTHTGSASTSASSSAAADGYNTRLSGTISGSCLSSTSATGYGTFGSQAVTIQPVLTTASAGEEFILKESNMFSYGTATYGNYVFDQADLQTTSSSTSSTTSSASKIQSAEATVSSSTSTTSSATRVRESDGTSSASTSGTSTAVYIVVTSGSTYASASVDISYIRKRNIGSLFVLESSTAAFAREKWEPIPLTAVTWNKLAA